MKLGNNAISVCTTCLALNYGCSVTAARRLWGRSVRQRRQAVGIWAAGQLLSAVITCTVLGTELQDLAQLVLTFTKDNTV